MNKQELIDKLASINLIMQEQDLNKVLDTLFYNVDENNDINVDNFYKFAKSNGLKDVEIVSFIKVNPKVLTEMGFKAFLRKYIFLSVIENDTNTRRIKYMKKSPKDFKTSLSKIYSKYQYLKKMGLEIDWNSLLRQKQEKLDKKVISSGGTPLSIEKIREMYPVDEEYIDELKLLAINNFGVLNDEKRRTR